MTKYQVTANPNASNSDMDFKQVIYNSAIPDCDLPVTLTEDQISTILYVLEGYCVGNDDEELVSEIDTIFEKLETVIDNHYDRLDELCKEK
tara:strand:+ start:2355 stop:2627 length:273 start_codon:yes stop_codon:yes gene_type:complete